MSDLRFDGRVVVVTGAGAGLGRVYALLFASNGAKVVVNDLGSTKDGKGGSSQAADIVVEEIKRNGGTAVADYNSVVEGEKIIKTAIDNFGRIDVLVNNAGILRDRSILKISHQDWDLVHDVHLKGSFKTTQSAFSYFKKQGYGRIIMTTSNSGLYGNFGQANYAAAKMGVVGLANTIAIEGQKYNIHCNCIAPTAASRLTEDILPPDLFAQLKPELIAPVVVYLCHESCEENGSIIEASAGWAGKCTIIRADGALLRSSINDGVSLEAVRDKWPQITDITKARRLNSIAEASAALMSSLEGLRSGQVEQSNGNEFDFTNRDTILYALGVGTSLARPEELKFLYEIHENFDVLPTFYIMPGMQSMFAMQLHNAVPGKAISLANILHGEHYIEVLRPPPAEGKLISKPRVVEVLDKLSGAVVVVEIDTFDQNGQLVVRNQVACFAVGAGNFAGPKNGTKLVPIQDMPKRKPDLSIKEKTTIDQAALYRLSGDRNPLHIDPNMAAAMGFKTAILHGLCTLGFSVRIILGNWAGFDSSLFKACKVRFVKPVIPGNTLKVDMWREGNRIHFNTYAVETNLQVIGGAYVDLKSTIMQPAKNFLSARPSLKSDVVFEAIIERVQADPEKAKAVGGLFMYNITQNKKPVKQWTMDLKNAKVFEGKPVEKPTTTVTIDDEDFLSLAEGKLSPQTAFLRGKLKITGNIMMAQKLAPLLKNNAKL